MLKGKILLHTNSIQSANGGYVTVVGGMTRTIEICDVTTPATLIEGGAKFEH